MKKAILMSLLFILLALSGCASKQDQELAVYKANMEQFFSNVRTINDAINALDLTAEDAGDKLLSYLDALDRSVQQMAALEVPPGFPGAAEYAEDAASCMTQAVSYYHEAYDGGACNASYEDAAYQYYERANNDLKQLILILRGELDLTQDASSDGQSSETDTAPAEEPSSQEEPEGSSEEEYDEFDFDETDEDEFAY